MDSGITTTVLVSALLVALVGALLGTAGFAAFVVRRQDRRMTALIERITAPPTPGCVPTATPYQIRDPRLQTALDRLAARVADTWRLATIDPLTGVPNRQAVMARLTDELARAKRSAGRCPSSSSTSTSSSG